MHNWLLIITFTIAIFFCSIQTVTSDISSYYYGSLSQNSETYFRPGQTSNTYRYQSLQVVIYTSGKYTFRSNSSLDTYGYLYSGSFDPLSPSRNLIASDDDSGGSGQFLINATLTYGTTYILVVTTFHPNIIGPFSITALGSSTVYFIPLTTTTTATTSTTTSSPLIPSYYYGSLSSSSGTYARPGQTENTFRYEAIQVTIFTSGKYTFKSYSSLDTYGYLYSYSFDPLNPSQNLIASDDDSGGSGQFLLNATLTYGTRYILVVSTYSPNVKGTYSVTALGPLSVTFSRLTPSTPVPFTTTSPRPVPSYYSSSLSQRSSIYARPGQSLRSYYYEAIRVAIYSSGGYILRSSSTLDTYGYLYLDSFDPLNPTVNLIASDDHSGGSSQFLLNVTLSYGRTYILVVTTYGPYVTGSYGVAVLGPSSASFSPYQPTTTVPTTTVGPLIPSSYSGALSPSSGIYARPDQASDTYYYQAIQVFVYTSGRYTFKSSSSLDTYGYFYSTSFDAYNPSLNLFASDDDSGGNRQFLLNVTLTYGRTYILVVTTYSSNVLGSFSVHALGPAVVSWSDIPPTFSSTLSDAEISAVVVGCIVFFGILLSSCAYRRFRQRIVHRRAVYLTADRKVQPGTRGSQMPYVVSSDYAHGSSVEKPPLSSN